MKSFNSMVAGLGPGVGQFLSDGWVSFRAMRPTIADPLVSLVGGRNETLVYAALLGGVPCVVMATIFLIVGITLRKGSSFDI